MRWDVLIMFILLIILGVLGFILYDNIPKQPVNLIFIKNNLSEIGNFSSYASEMQFYPNMRYPKLPITFSIEKSCSQDKTERTRKAFDILEKETNKLKFLEATNGEIKIACSEIPEPIRSDIFIAGEGGATAIMDTGLYNVIFNGSVYLYKTNYCPEPVVEIHEILHALGFKHSNNRYSIMYNVSECDQKITGDIINEIIKLYNTESYPDLYFKNIKGVKKGRYIDFEIEILNRGLDVSALVNMDVYADNDKIAVYNVTSLDIGNGVDLKVENLRGPRSFTELKFVIDAENSIKEIDKTNNIGIMEIEEA